MSVEPRIGNLYVCPVVNAMGPVTDARHSDLLNDWDQVSALMDRMFSPAFRNEFPDSSGAGAKFSWFFISWSGFKTNPVKRDFGYFNVYDYYRERWGARMAEFGDGMYWMYNHPAASGVGNEWGMDWLQNAHYLEILMRFVHQRSYFPAVVEVVTEKNDASHFLENFFPYDLGNRNSVDVNWEAKNADGKPMWEVIDWRRATHRWEVYSPDERNYQRPGGMKRKIGRLLDIKTIVYEFKEYEIEHAMQMCLEGQDAMISAYEHDFRDRAQVIRDRFLEPLSRVAARFPEVKWYYKNSLDGFNHMTGRTADDDRQVEFEVRTDAGGNLLIHCARGEAFGRLPFTFFERNGEYRYVAPLRVGEKTWLLYRTQIESGARLFAACNNPVGKSTIQSFEL